MGKCGLSRLWRCQSCITFGNHDDERPSTSGNVDAASVIPPDLHPVESLGESELRDACDRIFLLLKYVENARQSNRPPPRELDKLYFRRKLACLRILTELFRNEKPDESILGPYFTKGANDAGTLTYMIFRDVPYHLWLAVGLLSVGASLEKWTVSLSYWSIVSLHNWFNVEKEIKEECMHVFWEMWRLVKLLWELNYPQTQSAGPQQELRSFQLLLVQGSIMCTYPTNNRYLRRYLDGCSYKESFRWFLRKVKSANRTLHEWWQLRGIYEGLRSSPLPGRPGMNYPRHAVAIEREKEDVTEMLLKRNSGMKTMALIVSGSPGIGKTTLADAVFTSVHIPMCNYIRYTWLEQPGSADDGQNGFITKEEWIRYIWKEKEQKPSSAEEENIDNDSDDDEGYYQDSEGKEEEYDDDDEEINNYVPVESEEVYNFIYFDNIPTWELGDKLRWLLDNRKCSKQRILLTTRDLESTWRECAKVLTDDCMYNYVMLSSRQMVQQASPETRSMSVTAFTRKTVQQSQEIARSTMGPIHWWEFLASSTSTSTSTSETALAELLHNMCEGIPDWLVLLATYMAVTNDYTVLQQQPVSQSDFDNSRKWENLMHKMRELYENLYPWTHDYVALDIICYYSHCNNAFTPDCKQDLCGNGLSRLPADVSDELIRVLNNMTPPPSDDDEELRVRPPSPPALTWLRRMPSWCLGFPVLTRQLAMMLHRWPHEARALKFMVAHAHVDDIGLLDDLRRMIREDALKLLDEARALKFMAAQADVDDIGLLDELRWMILEDALKLLEERGVKPVSDETGRVRVAHPVQRYVFGIDMKPFHRFVNSAKELHDLEEELKECQATGKEPCIKALTFGENLASQQLKMDATGFHLMAYNLQILWLPTDSSLTLRQVSGEARNIDFFNLRVYRGPSHFPVQIRADMDYGVMRIMILHVLKDENLGWESIPPSLRYLHIKTVGNSFQPTISTAPDRYRAESIRLRALTLDFCNMEAEIIRMPEELCILNIRELNIKCQALYELAQSFGKLEHLEILRLQCSRLKRLPQGFGQLNRLVELQLYECESLEELCTDFWNLESLRALHWGRRKMLPKECLMQILRLKELKLKMLVVHPDLHQHSKSWGFGGDVEIFYTDCFTFQEAVKLGLKLQI